jgi:hypothetical protein
MALKNPSANCFRKFKGLQLTFQVVLNIQVMTAVSGSIWKSPRKGKCGGTSRKTMQDWIMFV